MIDVASELDFLRKEVVDGQFLADKLAVELPAPEEALRYAIQIGKALATLHSRGLVHGMVSPDHILLTADGARLLDPRTKTRPPLKRYRSPEQVRGRAVNWRTDIFSFGVLLYEMASGNRAFSGEGSELDDAILNGPPVPLMDRKSTRLNSSHL